MAEITPFQISLAGASWIDANSQYGQGALPDLLPDVLAVQNALNNLLACWIGGRSRTFQPEYGSTLWQFLQEPCDQSTANKIHTGLIQAVVRWEPRITVNQNASVVTPDLTLPGYNVRLVYALNINVNTNKNVVLAFNIKV